MLEKSLSNEDEFVLSYGGALIGQIDFIEDLSHEEKEKIKDTLAILLSDTDRHAKVVRELIESIKKDSRNEF